MSSVTRSCRSDSPTVAIFMFARSKEESQIIFRYKFSSELSTWFVAMVHKPSPSTATVFTAVECSRKNIVLPKKCHENICKC